MKAEKENKIQRAIRRRDEVLKLLKHSFLMYVPREDNSWRVEHNLIQLELEFERLLADYFIKMK